nr:glycoside hydrolase family 20 zincin-like fold domain-containing protein [Sphaerochaetaceae bacterium]
MRRIVPVLLMIALLVSCASAPKYTSYVAIKGADCPQAQFAADEIASALADDGIGISDVSPEWTIRFAEIDPSLGEQCYHIEVLGKIIEITGGDERGLMYGGLEVADTIELYGISAVKEAFGEPYITLRGTKFNIPLDMRTPSYSDSGTSGQENIDDMWDMGYWHEYIDELARNRYNVITIWNLNPFPSMVKVPEYPDIALDDVWRANNYPE